MFIVEDDAAFGYRTCTLVDAILRQNKDLDWDILFTDVCITNLKKMVDLLQYRRELSAKRIDIAFMELGQDGLCRVDRLYRQRQIKKETVRPARRRNPHRSSLRSLFARRWSIRRC